MSAVSEQHEAESRFNDDISIKQSGRKEETTTGVFDSDAELDTKHGDLTYESRLGNFDSRSEQGELSGLPTSVPLSAQSSRSIAPSIGAIQYPQSNFQDFSPEDIRTTKARSRSAWPPSVLQISKDIEAYTALGTKQMSSGNMSSAMNAFHVAFNRAALLEDTDYICSCCLNMGACYISCGQPAKALEFLLRANTLTNSVEFRADLDLNFAAAYEALEHRDAAIYHFHLAISELKDAGKSSSSEYADANYRLARLLLDACKYRESALACQNALSVYKLNNSSPSKIVSCSIRLAECLVRDGRSAEACSHLDSVLDACKLLQEHTSRPIRVIASMRKVSDMYVLAGDTISAKECLEWCLRAFEQMSDDNEASAMKTSRADLHVKLCQLNREDAPEQALLDMDIAAELYEQLNDAAKVSEAYRSMSEIYRSTNRPQESFSYGLKAHDFVRGSGSNDEQLCLKNLGCCFEEVGKHDKAAECFAASLMMIGQTSDAGKQCGDNCGYHSLVKKFYKSYLAAERSRPTAPRPLSPPATPSRVHAAMSPQRDQQSDVSSRDGQIAKHGKRNAATRRQSAQAGAARGVVVNGGSVRTARRASSDRNPQWGPSDYRQYQVTRGIYVDGVSSALSVRNQYDSSDESAELLATGRSTHNPDRLVANYEQQLAAMEEKSEDASSDANSMTGSGQYDSLRSSQSMTRRFKQRLLTNPEQPSTSRGSSMRSRLRPPTVREHSPVPLPQWHKRRSPRPPPVYSSSSDESVRDTRAGAHLTIGEHSAGDLTNPPKQTSRHSSNTYVDPAETTNANSGIYFQPSYGGQTTDDTTRRKSSDSAGEVYGTLSSVGDTIKAVQGDAREGGGGRGNPRDSIRPTPSASSATRHSHRQSRACTIM